MRKFKLFDPNNKEWLVYFEQMSARQARRGQVAMSEYLNPSNIGLNPNNLKGLSGYELAAALREAADYLDDLASLHEHAHDAFADAAEACEKGGKK